MCVPTVPDVPSCTSCKPVSIQMTHPFCEMKGLQTSRMIAQQDIRYGRPGLPQHTPARTFTYLLIWRLLLDLTGISAVCCSWAPFMAQIMRLRLLGVWNIFLL